MRFIIIALLTVIAGGCASLDPMPAKYAETQYIVQLPGKSAQDLYGLARKWAGETFVSDHEKVRLEDKDSHIIIATGIGTVSDMVTRYYTYTLIIELKDNKARLTFKDVQGLRLHGIHPPSFGLESQRSQAFNHFAALRDDFVKAITSTVKNW